MWCFHDRLKEFTFKDGTTIKMCPDCTQFDTKRIEALRTGNVEMPKAKEELHWKFVLEKAGLGMDVGDRPEFTMSVEDAVSEKALWKASGGNPDFVNNVVGDKFDVLSVLSALSKRTQISYTAVDDHEWDAKQRPFPHTLQMPRRFTSYCVACIDVVVDEARKKVRTTKGVYLPIEHVCDSVRVYDLQNSLIEVKAI